MKTSAVISDEIATWRQWNVRSLHPITIQSRISVITASQRRVRRAGWHWTLGWVGLKVLRVSWVVRGNSDAIAVATDHKVCRLDILFEGDTTVSCDGVSTRRTWGWPARTHRRWEGGCEKKNGDQLDWIAKYFLSKHASETVPRIIKATRQLQSTPAYYTSRFTVVSTSQDTVGKTVVTSQSHYEERRAQLSHCVAVFTRHIRKRSCAKVATSALVFQRNFAPRSRFKHQHWVRPAGEGGRRVKSLKYQCPSLSCFSNIFELKVWVSLNVLTYKCKNCAIPWKVSQERVTNIKNADTF